MALALAGPAEAIAGEHDITVKANAGMSTGGSWSGDTFTSSADDAILDVDDLKTHLAAGPVSIVTGPGGSEAGEIDVDAEIDDATCAACGALTFQPTGNLDVTRDIDLSNSLSLVSSGSIALDGVSLTSAGTITLASSGPAVLLGSTTLTSSSSFVDAVLVDSSVDLSNGSLTVSGNGRLDGTVSGSSGIVETGSGTLTLAQQNTYAGSTDIESGTLDLGVSNAIPVGSLLTDEGTLDLAGGVQRLGCLSGGGTVTSTAGGDPATLDLDTATPCGFNGSITGNLTVRIEGAGMGLSSDDTYSGGTIIDAHLGVGSATAIPAGSNVTLNQGDVELGGQSISIGNLTGSGGNVDSDVADATVSIAHSGDNSFGGQISGRIALNVSGTGRWTLSGENVYTGATSVAGTTIALSLPDALPMTTALDLESDGTLDLNGNNEHIGGLFGSGTVENTSTTGATVTVTPTSADTFAGSLVGPLGLTVLGPITGGPAPFILTGTTNSYSGVTSVTSGATLQLGADSVLPSSTTLLDLATVDLDDHAQTVAALTGDGTVINSGTHAPTLTVDDPEADEFDGRLTGNMGLVKSGAGRLTLAGLNSNHSATVDTDGTLVVDGAIGTIELAGGDVAGIGQPGTLDYQSGIDLIEPGDPGTGNLRTAGATLDPHVALAVALDGATAGSGYDRLSATGPVSLNGASLFLSVGSGFVPAVGESFTIVTGTSVSGTFSGLPEGSTFTASGYRFQISYDAAQGDAITLTRVKYASTITAAASTSAGQFGSPVTFTARVAPQITPLTPTGTVTFSDGSQILGTVPLSQGTATLQVSSLGDGDHQIIASYSGDSTFLAGSSSPAMYSVSPRPLLSVAHPPRSATRHGRTTIDTGLVVSCPSPGASCAEATRARIGGLHGRGVTVARCRLSVKPGNRADISCRLRRDGQAMLHGRKRLVVRLTVTVHSGAEGTATLHRLVTVHRG